MFYHHKKKALAVLLGVLCSTADAQLVLGEIDDDLALLYGDEEMISIATGTQKPIHLAPSVASVITAKDIRDIGARTLDEALEMVPGLHVGRSFNRLNSLYSIRGLHTKNNPQVLVLMNGRPFRALFSGGRPNDFSLPVQNISRIEIIRGPGSAIYGADAFAGTINIITKNAGEIGQFNVGARTGSFDTQDAWVQYGSTEGWDIAFDLESSRSDGDRDRIVNTDFQTTLDSLPFAGVPASLAPGPLETRYQITNSHLKLSQGAWGVDLWGWQQRDAGVGPGAAQALDSKGRDNVDAVLFDLHYRDNKFAKDWEIGGHLSHFYHKLDAKFVIFPPGTTVLIGNDGNLFTGANVVNFPDGVLGNPGSTDNITEIELESFYDGMSQHRWRMAAGVRSEKEKAFETKNFGPGVIDGSVSPIDGTLTNVTGTTNVYIGDRDREVNYISVQDEWSFAPDWELTGGVRYDHYSDFGSTINPRIAVVWATDYNLTSKLLYGSAFRPPSFNELYAQNNPSILGSPTLSPETIRTLELAFDYRPTFEVETQVNLFRYEIDDVIDLVGGVYQNAKNQKGHGAEIEADWKPSDKFILKGNVAWQHSEDESTGHQIADAPVRQSYLAAIWKYRPEWTLSSRLKWVGGRKRAQTDMRNEIKDYTLVDVTMRRAHFARNWAYAVSIRNLFDEDAREPSDGKISEDYPLEGRSVYLEVSYSLGR